MHLSAPLWVIRMPLRDVYERTFDENVLLSRNDEGHAEEQDDDQREAHNAGESGDPTEVTQ